MLPSISKKIDVQGRPQSKEQRRPRSKQTRTRERDAAAHAEPPPHPHMYNEGPARSKGSAPTATRGGPPKNRSNREEPKNLKTRVSSSSTSKLPSMTQPPKETPPEPRMAAEAEKPAAAPVPDKAPDVNDTRMRKPLPSRKRPLSKNQSAPTLKLDADLKKVARQFETEHERFDEEMVDINEEMSLRAPNRAPRTLNLGQLSLVSDRPQPLWGDEDDSRVAKPISIGSPQWNMAGGDKNVNKALRLLGQLADEDDAHMQLQAAKKLRGLLKGEKKIPAAAESEPEGGKKKKKKGKKKKKKKASEDEGSKVPATMAALEEMWRFEKESALREIATRREIRKALGTPPPPEDPIKKNMTISEKFRDDFYDLDVNVELEMERMGVIEPRTIADKEGNDGKFWERWLTSEYDWQMTKQAKRKPAEPEPEPEPEPESESEPEPEPDVDLTDYVAAFQLDQPKKEVKKKNKKKKKKTVSPEEKIRRLSPLCRFPHTGKVKMTLEGTLDMTYDIYEKKCIADEADVAAGTAPDAMVHFLEDYFMQKFGLKKMADQKLGDYIIALFHYDEEHRRIPPLLRMIGLEDETFFSRLPGDLMSLLLARAFKGQLKSIAEQLDEDPDYVEQAKAVDMVIGFEVKREATADWDCPQLRKLAHTSQIEVMLQDIEALPAKKMKGIMMVDLDDVIDIVMRRFFSWCKDAIAGLSAAWEAEAKLPTPEENSGDVLGDDATKTDTSEDDAVRRITFEDFTRIVHSTCNQGDISTDRCEELWVSLLDHLEYDANDGIDHPLLFAVGCMQLGIIPRVEAEDEELGEEKEVSMAEEAEEETPSDEPGQPVQPGQDSAEQPAGAGVDATA